MGRTHLLIGPGVALAVLVLVGCAAKPKSAANRPGRGAPPAPAVADRGGPGGAAGEANGAAPGEAPVISPAEATPNSIAQHAQVYAHNLETLLAKRSGGAPVKPESSAEVPAPQRAEEPVAAANAQLKVESPVSQKQTAAPEVKAPEVKAPEVKAPKVAVAAAVAAPAPSGAKPQAAVPAESSAQRAEYRATAAQASPSLSPSVAPTADQLLQKLGTRVREYPGDVAAHLEYQLLQFLRGEPVPELASVAPLPAEDRELLTALLDGLSNFRNALRAETNMLQSRKVAPLLEMSDRLRSLGELTIPAAALCTKVERFGVYDPMEPAQFHNGPNNEAILYCEVANFSSQLNSNRQWETRLKHEAVVYNETGLNVWTAKADTVSDLSRNRRHDFYVVRRLRLPTLPVGRYLLKVTVTDLQVSRVAESTVPIQVMAP